MFLILLAGLQSLPVEPFEAARVDGAGAWRTFVDHTLPMLRPVILVAVVAAHDRCAHDVRPGLRAHPRRSGHLDPADLDLRLRDVLPVPAVRLRRGDAADGRARRGARVRVPRGAADATAGARREALLALSTCSRWSPAVVALVPLVWMVETSLKSNREITQDGTLYPHTFTFANYRSSVLGRAASARTCTNSIGRHGAERRSLSLVLGTLAAYSIARFRLWRRTSSATSASAC